MSPGDGAAPAPGKGEGQEHTTAATKSSTRFGQRAGLPSHAAQAEDVVTRYDQLPGDMQEKAAGIAATVALASGDVAVALGTNAEGLLAICEGGRCCSYPGCLVVVPDVVAAEFAANGQQEQFSSPRLQRDDGRSVYLFRGVGGDQ